jgi:activator of HSP90 ATPase
MKSLKKYYYLKASVADIYNALTNPVMIEIWTGEKVEYQTEPNTEFSLWDGAITGRNIEFIENKLIRQVWYFEELESEVTIKLHPDKEATNVELRQENIPDDAFDNIAEGWDEDFFGSLEELFND